jgi:propanol-preferring alcohol dehydrogenase
VNVGTFDRENTVDMKNGIRKRLTFHFSYGGLTEDLEAVLGLIQKGVIQPVVEERGPTDFPAILQGLMDGTIKGRMALKWE